MATPTTQAKESSAGIFIVDNSNSDWKVRSYLTEWCEYSKAIDVATGYFEIGSLLALGEKWQSVDRFRILMGDEVSMRTKRAFSEGLKKIAQRLDASLEGEKTKDDFLAGVPAIVAAIRAGKIECRVYRKDKFHAKACITHGRAAVVGSFGLVGSSNFEKAFSKTKPLIATDVLAEGLNLQDASRLINYDLHWNPVRLMQRIGRVDRRMNAATEAQIVAAHPELAGERGAEVLDGTQLTYGNQNRPVPTPRNPQDPPRKRVVVRRRGCRRRAHRFGEPAGLSQGYAEARYQSGRGFQRGGQIAPPLGLEFDTAGGRQLLQCWNTEGIFRLIQSIPSPKAEPFKRWLARVGYERVQEIENPELATKRTRALYKAKGCSDDWIEKRMRSIASRDELTGEWKKRGVKEQRDYAILTAEISKAAFGLTPADYAKLKGLKRENLRDHMSDLELIFSMLGEAATTEIARNKDAQGFPENHKAARDGGTVAGSARRDLEKKSGRKVVTRENYLGLPQSAKKAAKLKQS